MEAVFLELEALMLGRAVVLFGVVCAFAATPSVALAQEDAQAQFDSVSSMDWSGAQAAEPASTTRGRDGAQSRLSAPYYPTPVNGDSPQEAFAKLPADLRQRAEEGFFVETAGMSEQQITQLRDEIAADNYQQLRLNVGYMGAKTTVLDGVPGSSLYFAQVYGQKVINGVYTIVGCNIELFTTTRRPTAEITYGNAMQCGYGVEGGWRSANLGEIVPRLKEPLAVDYDYLSHRNYGDNLVRWGDSHYNYDRRSEEQVEQIYGYFNVYINGVTNDGWLTYPASTGERVDCQGQASQQLTCEIQSKPFAFIPDDDYTCTTGPTCTLVNQTINDANKIVNEAPGKAQEALANAVKTADDLAAAANDAAAAADSALAHAASGSCRKVPGGGYPAACASDYAPDADADESLSTLQYESATSPDPSDQATAARVLFGMFDIVPGGDWAIVRSGPKSYPLGSVRPYTRFRVFASRLAVNDNGTTSRYYGGRIAGFGYSACEWVLAAYAQEAEDASSVRGSCPRKIDRATFGIEFNCTEAEVRAGCENGTVTEVDRTVPKCATLPGRNTLTTSCGGADGVGTVPAGTALRWRYVSSVNSDWAMVRLVSDVLNPRWVFVPKAALVRCPNGDLPTGRDNSPNRC